MTQELQRSKGSKAKDGAFGNLSYLHGFGNHFESEAEPGALPRGQNSPQHVPYGLYAEQLSGTAFSAVRHENQRSWLYRIRPSVMHSEFRPVYNRLRRGRPFTEAAPVPNQLRWDPLAPPSEPVDFVDGLVTLGGNGDSGSVRGCAVHLYTANRSMERRFFSNADGEFLIVPQEGALVLFTEFGVVAAAPGEIAVMPKGIRYRVEVVGDFARGYVLENYGPALRLPDLGLIGANGLANARDFQTPVASYGDEEGEFKLVTKFQGQTFECDLRHYPLDVVAWHGNYVPYKYDLCRFNTIGSVSFDHLDPSSLTVLTSPSELAGVANVDFVIFPPRWMVAEHSFRPPYFHRNCMSEFMGLIAGRYDAKEEGFLPGGASLHNTMSAHGPDAATYERAVQSKLNPEYLADTMAFMFESSLPFSVTKFGLESPARQKDYLSCWRGLRSNFRAPDGDR